MLQDKSVEVASVVNLVEVASVVNLVEVSFVLKAGLTIHLAYIHSFIGFMTSLPFVHPNLRTCKLGILVAHDW
jgi:hypothetical protein